MGPGGYFQLDWISPRPLFRPYMHAKRARFNQETRPRDAIVIRGDGGKLFSGTSTQQRRHYADGKDYNL
jgi:hypothetical protein